MDEFVCVCVCNGSKLFSVNGTYENEDEPLYVALFRGVAGALITFHIVYRHRSSLNGRQKQFWVGWFEARFSFQFNCVAHCERTGATSSQFNNLKTVSITASFVHSSLHARFIALTLLLHRFSVFAFFFISFCWQILLWRLLFAIVGIISMHC